MPTNSAFARLYNKKILGLTQLKDQVVNYLRAAVKETVSQFFGSGGAAFSQIIPITANAGALLIDIGKATPATGNYFAADGNGHIITLAPNSYNGIKIPPSAVLYGVALYVSEVEDGVEVNPRSGEIEYSTTKETIGQVTTPSVVVDNTNTLTFTVDGLFDTSTDHSGRQVRVWMKPKGVSGSPGPQSSVASVAIETCTVVYSGGANKITTASHFGTAATYVANASHFYIQCVGPTVRKRTTQDLRSAQGYMYLGSVTSPGSGVIPGGNITTAEQSLVSISMTEVGQVLYKDAHGSIKIKVKADASDSNANQMEVQDSAGTTVWSVDEDGDVMITGSVAQYLLKQGSGGLYIGTSSSGGDVVFQANGTEICRLNPATGGTLQMNTKKITGLAAPTAASSDAANAAYVDAAAAAALASANAHADAAVAAGDKAHGWIYQELAANTVLNSTGYTALSDLAISILQANLVLNMLIEFEIMLFGMADANGRGVFLSGSATANFATLDSRVEWWDWSAGQKVADGLYYSTAPGGAQATNLSGVQPRFIRNRGMLKVSSTSGVLIASPQFKTSAGTFTIDKGSYIRYRVFAGP